MPVAYWRVFLRCPFGFKVRFERFNHFLKSSSLEPLLLGATPLIGFVATADRCRRPQILADMIKIAEKLSLLSEDLSAPQSDPIGPISDRMDPAVQPPARLARAVSPAPPGFLHRPKGGRVNRRRTVQSLCRH